MSKTEMLAKLRSLHEELVAINVDTQNAEQVDEQTIDALGQIITDVSSILDRLQDNVETEAEAELNSEDLLERVRNFESEHPLVGRFLNQVSDLLGNMGV